MDAEEQARRQIELFNGNFSNASPSSSSHTHRGNDGDDGSDVRYLDCTDMGIREAFMLAMEDCEKHDVGLVVVDSVGMALEGDAESSRDVIAFFKEIVATFKRRGIVLLLVDHMAKVREGEKYQNKGVFGSVFKSNNVRSVIQLQQTDKDDTGISVRARHTKCNVGPKQEPFGIRLEWGFNATTITSEELTNEELAEENHLNSKDRVLLALEGGPMFPDDIAKATGLEVGSTKNALTALRKAAKVTDTDVRSITGARQVKLSKDQHSCEFLIYPCKACERRPSNAPPVHNPDCIRHPRDRAPVDRRVPLWLWRTCAWQGRGSQGCSLPQKNGR